MTTFSDEFNRLVIELITSTTYTSASGPDVDNTVKVVGQTINPDFEDMIINIVEEIVKFRLEEIGIPVGDRQLPEKEEKTTDDAPTDQKSVDKEQTDNATQTEIQSFLYDALGGKASKETLLKFGKNPRAVALGLIQSLPFIGGIVAAADFAQALITELDRIDSFFKVFIPDITDLHNQLRAREETAFVQVGDQQLILTVRSGSTSPRTAYNTYNIFNKNRVQLESDFAIRDNSGV